MSDRVIVRRGAYHDSVTLMRVSAAAAATQGARDVAVAMATPLNLELLDERRFDLPESGRLTGSDLVIAIRAEDAEAADRILATVEAELSADSRAGPSAAAPSAHASLLAATRQHPELSLAIVSVPGRYAAYEAAVALEAGLHVFCFSDGVSLEHEARLKRTAGERDLMFMGPDCGTAIIDGVALGFANDVRCGPVGIVGASGTGIQEVCCLLDLAGVGISHAIGVGGRDLAPEIGGAMLRRGLLLLAEDPATDVIVVVSKPPDRAVALTIHEQAAVLGKPVILALLGLEGRPSGVDSVVYVDCLEAAAARAAELVGHQLPALDGGGPAPAAQGQIRGLFSGGTLCTEAMLVVSAKASRVVSNIPLRPEWRLADLGRSDGHVFIDFGSDELTAGRPHPMIDPTLRLERLAREARDPAVGVILLDLVLGYGADQDPAAEFVPLIARARAEREDLAVVVALVGTDSDPQGLADQRQRLEDAGAIVSRSVAQAARLALSAAMGAGEVP